MDKILRFQDGTEILCHFDESIYNMWLEDKLVTASFDYKEGTKKTKRPKNLKIEIAGTTPEGKQSLKGLFKVYDQMGMPLDSILDWVRDDLDCVLCWESFYAEARGAGWKNKTIDPRVHSAVVDSYGKIYYEEWVKVFTLARTQGRI